MHRHDGLARMGWPRRESLRATTGASPARNATRTRPALLAACAFAAMSGLGLAACSASASGGTSSGNTAPAAASAASAAPASRGSDETSVPKSFVAGKIYQSCLAYLMPGGGSIRQVQWGDGPHAADQVTTYFDHPIVWGAG